jgi:hypothetical protein
MRPVDIMKKAEGMKLQDVDGNSSEVKLLPPLSQDELDRLQAKIPCPIPAEARELFSYCRGFEGILEEIDFSGLLEGFGLEEIFPHAVPIAHDGFGNYWIVDLTTNSMTWGPIYFACHDAPVIVFQTDSLAHFIQELLRFGNPPWKSEIDDVHEKHVRRIWKDNPGLMSYEQCFKIGDTDLMSFAKLVGPGFLYIDLRNPKTGDGFSWGRYGGPPRSEIKRSGEKAIFAYQIRPSLWQKLFGKIA